jgi:hypothetical protein
VEGYGKNSMLCGEKLRMKREVIEKQIGICKEEKEAE